MPTFVAQTTEDDNPIGPVPFTNNPGAMVVLTSMFFMWGLITVLNDIVIPHLKAEFHLNYFEGMLVQFCFFSAYFLFALPFAKLVEAVGYQKTMVTGLCTSAVGCLLFVPAALIAWYPLFLGAMIVLAAGLTALQVSANPYVSLLGHPQSASSRLNLAQALNSLGTTIAPFVGSILILGIPAEASAVVQAHAVILPYVILAAVLFAIALFVGLSNLPQMVESSAARTEEHKAAHNIFHYPQATLGALAIFLYVGAEVSIGSFMVNYFENHSIGNLDAQTAGKFVALYWGGAMVGRFIGSAVLRQVKTNILLATVAGIAGLLVIGSMLSTGHVAMVLILAVGLFNSVMFPNIFTLGIAKLGPLTGEGSGLLIAAIVGGAIIPVAQGAIADRIGIHHAFILPVVCYLYIIYYGLVGSKPVAVPELA